MTSPGCREPIKTPIIGTGGPIRKTYRKILLGGLSVAGLLGLALGFFIHPDPPNRLPSSYEAAARSDNYVHFEDLRISAFIPEGSFFLANTNSFSQLSIANLMPKVTLSLEMECTDDFFSGLSSFSAGITKRNFAFPRLRSRRFTLKPGKKTAFLFGRDTRACTLVYRNSLNPDDFSQTGRIQIQSETAAFPWLNELVEKQDTCPEADSLNPQLSCPHWAKKLEPLDTPESGFLAKTEMLLGQKLAPSFIRNQDPHAEIDFSKAPKLKAIFLATLVYRADFYGTVMARLLKFHAERGTLVYLVTTGYMMLDKDKKLLYPLSQNGHFRLQEFKYHDPRHDPARLFRIIDNRYRDMHIKLLITLADEETRNAVVTGGRNIHDGFLFATQPDHSRFSDLVHYGRDEDFVHWNDFEMKITSKEIAEVTAAHFLRFWNRDTATQQMTDFATHSAVAAPTPSEAQGPLQHFISLPYADDSSLEKLYVRLIDGARSSIKISSPYLRPTNSIAEALVRAIDRKVDVTIQTRINLVGDTQAWLYEEVNKETINAFFDKVKIYEWKGDSILHSKFILVDGELGFIGSVNLSRRSFIQDAENGYLIKDPAFIHTMEGIFNSYLAKSSLITEKQGRKIIPSLLIQLLKNQF